MQKFREIDQSAARRVWLHAQRLTAREPFGAGPTATPAAVAHLGYVQIDTIHVVERCHHHILWTRIPSYRREHLHRAQSIDKTVFEYWTHALAYVPTADYRFFMREMKRFAASPPTWFGKVTPARVRRIVRMIRKNGPLSIRDVEDDVLVEKHHPWASRKPSKRALQVAFYTGALTISERTGMLKTYEIPERHFGWTKRPRAATEAQINEYILDRAIRSQGIISLDSACYGDAQRKPAVRKLIDRRVRRGTLLPLRVGNVEHWAPPEALDVPGAEPLVHILSPFDPLVIQRKRLELFFDYAHKFEAYLPKEKRVFGYFALPVLLDDAIVAVIDLKTDRAKRRLEMRQWTWVGCGSARTHKRRIEEELHRFEAFQLGIIRS